MNRQAKKSPAMKATKERSIAVRRQRALSKLIALLGDDYRSILERDERVRTGLANLDAREPIGEPLRRFRGGEITASEYLDIKVDTAMARVRGLLPDDDYLYVRAMVRERVETDPVLVALVRRLLPSSTRQPCS